MTDRVRLYIIIDQPTLALSIPLNICTTLSLRPLKWLRFLGYAIYGQDGHLSLSAGGEPISDYTSNLTARPYYLFIHRLNNVTVFQEPSAENSFHRASTSG